MWMKEPACVPVFLAPARCLWNCRFFLSYDSQQIWNHGDSRKLGAPALSKTPTHVKKAEPQHVGQIAEGVCVCARIQVR